MNRRQIVIGKPYIIDLVSERKSRLCAEVTTSDSTEAVLYYEVDIEYKEYLNDGRADAFLLGLLHSAMYEDLDIQCKAGVTEQLLFQLRTYYIPIVSKNMSNMSFVNIEAEVIEGESNSAGAIGTGNSGGVDSFYTILRYGTSDLGKYRITHLLFTNISTEDDDEKRIRALFRRDRQEKDRIASALGLQPVNLYTNLFSFYKHPGIFNHFFALQYISAVHALSRLFSVYYFSSTFTVDMFSMDEKKIISSARYDIFSLDCTSISSLKIYSAGMELDRLGKMDYICGNLTVQKHLQVCAIEQSAGGYRRNTKLNCGHCHKCSRTISILYAYGLLEKYEGIFDLIEFQSNKARFIGRGLAADQRTFSRLVIRLLKERRCLPLGTDFWRAVYSFRYALSKVPFLVKMYRSITKYGEAH